MNKLNIAFWFSESIPKDRAKVELHVNVWKVPLEKNKNAKFLDIGLMIRDYVPQKHLFMYVPDPKFQKKCFYDLGGCLTNNQNTAFNAVFNEYLDITTGQYDKFIGAKRDSDNFVLYKLDPNTDDVSVINNQFDGSLVKIKIPTIPPKFEGVSHLYLRFRISGQCIENSFSSENLASDTLQYFTTRIELFDMRINEIRTLNDSLVQFMYEGTVIGFTKVQFFLMCEAKEELVLSKTGQKNARNLENEIWGDYIGSIGKFKDNNSIIAYQWSKDADKEKLINDFSMLFKIKLDTFGKWKIVFVFLFVFFVGVASSMTGSKLYDVMFTGKVFENELSLRENNIAVEANGKNLGLNSSSKDDQN